MCSCLSIKLIGMAFSRTHNHLTTDPNPPPHVHRLSYTLQSSGIHTPLGGPRNTILKVSNYTILLGPCPSLHETEDKSLCLCADWEKCTRTSDGGYLVSLASCLYAPLCLCLTVDNRIFKKSCYLRVQCKRWLLRNTVGSFLLQITARRPLLQFV